MKKHIYKLAIVFCFALLSFSVSAQQVNTMYFMENVPVRHYLNPAYQPLSNFYLGFPVLGYTQFNVGNNSLTIKDVVYNNNGQTILFLHPNGDKNKFYNTLKISNLFDANAQINLLDFGFRSNRAYWTFSLTEKVDVNMGIPKDFMKLLLYGTPEIENNLYNFKSLGADATLYTEAALGYSKNINDKWSWGTKLKFLYGNFNINYSNQNLDLSAGIDQWTLKGKGVFNYAGFAKVVVGDSLKSIDVIEPNSTSEYARPVGLGAAFDLGLTYKPIESLTLSAAITDLGMIHWNRNVQNVDYNIDYKFDGMYNFIAEDYDEFDQEDVTDSLLTALKNSQTSVIGAKAYNTYTKAKINVGLEYAFLNDKMSVGVLSRTILNNKHLYEEVTASYNLRPIDWFNLSLSYSFLNAKTSRIGAGLGLKTAFVNWFVAADYVPLYYAKNIPIPVQTSGVNLAFGANFIFGNKKDADKDGVEDRKDKCPETPLNVLVDKKGCPVDEDGDGVPDYLDKCPKTELAAYSTVDERGCPTDKDGDEVPDYLDKCPNTPQLARGMIDVDGCPIDKDKDGVPDYLDKCPNTPASLVVDSNGCPPDTDGDDVPDYLDQCPGTPAESRGKVDEKGCPLDTDGDGVFDYIDKCPGTPAEARAFIDSKGCPIDTDGDGVADYVDQCPNTPKQAYEKVNSKGCPLDTDSDGVFDYIDNCPTIAGVLSNFGCPEIKNEVKKLFQKALQGIQFETNKATIKKTSFVILDQIVTALNENPTYIVDVRGHTDNVGQPKANMILSERRATAVMNYLLDKGIQRNRLSSHGFGDTQSVATNKTNAGKAKNRRVEFVVTFEEVVLEK